ncbi:MAG TPA: type II toxin-antitoxin system VapC family toxin [Thermomicrobiales bacterium]|jgi:predicted nucleic acid-binding protein|nr:type II toxin-antitoxin system VapC family toxin [Thermomicrobiales bacterium]
MLNSSTVCVDANLIVRLITGLPDDPVRRIWREWDSTNSTRVAPFLFRYEVTNAIYRIGRTRRLNLFAIQDLLELALALPISLDDAPALHGAAVAMAVAHAQPATYDAHYLALADKLGIDFYTGDRRLWNAVHHQLPWVHLVTDEPPSPV